LSIDATTDLNAFFETTEFDAPTFERFADAAFSSAEVRDRFAALVNEYRTKVEGGQGEALKLAVGLLILNSFADSLTWFAKSKDNKFRRYYAAQAMLAQGRTEDAIAELAKAAGHGWDSFAIDMETAAAHIRTGDTPGAEKIVRKHERDGADRADWHYVRGLIAERHDDRFGALDAYEKALTLDPDHVPTMFRAAFLYDLRAEDGKAVELYKRLALQPRAHVNALINLAVLYEDRGIYEAARGCLRRVLTAYPNHARARLFLKDVESSRMTIIDDSVEQRAENRNRMLDTPIGEFELSVRARNCLKKMKINTIGELIKLNEAELMAYKNFGETSLNEIKAMLVKKGLRLGMRPEELDTAAVVAVAPPPVVRYTVPPGSEAILGKPVSEMELSVRARRCLQRLNIATVGDLIQHTEQDLLSTRNFGVTSLQEIKARLVDMNLSLAPKA
jgi:DNA-directed RNA polymerase subunit alpha